MDFRHPLAVITPTLDGDVLARLALADAAFSAGQLRRLIPRASVDGIRKVLKRLTAQGIVIASPAGGAAVTYRLNREHLAAPAIIDLSDPAATLRNRVTGLLRSWTHPPRYAALFGSSARDEAGTESDVDLFLIRPPATDDDLWDEQIASLESSVTRWTGNDARALVVDENDLPRREGDPVLRSVAREGIPVLGDVSWFRSAVRTRSHGEVADAHE
jgi:hypothetical protein